MNKYDNFIGKLLDNKYRILDVVGTGGMSVVLKAEDINMKRLVAIKILNEEYTGNEQAEKRFANEAKAVAMLSHRNIVSIYDIAMYPDMKYIVMEFLDGITLREYLDNKGAISWKEACIYVLQILRALEHAHSKGVIHRDIKPQNVLLLKSGEIKVTDFGIAKTPTSHSLTLTQKAIGTVYYISPEQACGKPTGYASDLYSLGVMMFEAVTGSLPFMGDNSVQIAMMQVNNPPPDPQGIVPSLPIGVKQIILKAMEKDPANRFSSAHSMAKAIEWLLRNPDVEFSDNNGAHDIGDEQGVPVSVAIDMINTSDIEPYGQTEIVESISGHKPKKQKKKKKERKPKDDAPRKKSRSMFPIISGVTFAFLAVALVLGVLAAVQVFSDIFSTDETPTAAFPNIVGSVWNPELESQLLNGKYGANFKVDKIIYVQNNSYKTGQVTATEPTAGSTGKLNPNDADTYFHFTSISVCKKTDDVIVPDVRYQKSNAARMILLGDEYGFEVEVIKEENINFLDDQVIRTEPSVGEIIKIGSSVKMYICSHIARSDTTAEMPDLRELTIAEAKARAEYALYTVEVVYEQTDFYTPNTVIRQSVEPGQKNAAHTIVTLTVAEVVTGYPFEDYTGKTYAEVLDSLNMIGLRIEHCSYFYIENGDTLIKSIAAGGQDYYGTVARLKELGYVETEPVDTATAAYQSIAKGTVVAGGESVFFIFGVDPALQE